MLDSPLDKIKVSALCQPELQGCRGDGEAWEDRWSDGTA